MESNAKTFDQFYTKDVVAESCLYTIISTLKSLRYDTKKIHFLEPSAGDGAFIRAIRQQGNSFSAYDIDPKSRQIKRCDYLDSDLSALLPSKSNVAVVGNPPFGKRARLAVQFVNTSLRYADTVAFILPLQFDKYSAQKQINPLANLVYNEKLEEQSFLFEGEPYAVRCCLQIWTTRQGLPDLRLRQPPQIHHCDFEMWQYNNTREAEKYFDKSRYTWDFAVPRQGYKDYAIRETDPAKMSRRTQWIFFKAKNKNILHNLQKIDFDQLSHKNTSTPGFGKADVIQAYNKIYGKDTTGASIVIHTFQLGDPKPNFAGTLPLPGTL